MKLRRKLDNKQSTYHLLTENYTCFTYDPKSEDPVSISIFATNKDDCVNKYNVIGKDKPSGVWDKICKTDKECLFYKQNKNYPNDFGRCINGKCQLPRNMRNLGYHYYINSKVTQPLCYNCNTTSWQPITDLNFCCEKQKDKKKYPFLNGPDYAFQNDHIFRYNYNLEKNCVKKNLYPNIFQKSNISRIRCKNYFDLHTIR